MAFFDFLNKDIGGMTAGENDPDMGGSGGKGATGIKWGDFLTKLSQGGSGNQPSPFASSLVSQYPGTTGQQPIQTKPVPLEEPKKKDDSDMTSILQVIAAIYGIPVG